MISLLSVFNYVPFLGSTKIESENGIMILTENNFKKALDEHEPLLVKFYLPWCNRCRNFAPEYLKVGEMLKNSHINMGQVDVETEKALLKEHKIKAFPAVRLFRNGTYINYMGLQKAEHIAAWAQRHCEQ
ncbi:hypothetical protein Zmor_004815 [Zophobas morio]|uniref:Thioredoxin domain-containing protein n=1 Tax=Zophobas morio TaxID=2755281 RepID=A0AA38IST2_9CUCU|nr:hypothetical protein Zmor_004815 [Zophobas morio]